MRDDGLMPEPLIGFSTGGVALADQPPLAERIRALKAMGCNAIELGFVRASCARDELVPGIDPALLEGFVFVSLHAPGGKWPWNNAEKTHVMLQQIENIHRAHPLGAVVVHPDAVPDYSVFDDYTFPVAYENQDCKKPQYKTVEAMQTFFAQRDYPFVLDLQHCASNDPTLATVQDFIAAFSGRLVEIQVAAVDPVSFADPDAGAVKHAMLHLVPSENILAALKQFCNVPIIIEGSSQTLKEAEKELAFVRSVFRSHLVHAA